MAEGESCQLGFTNPKCYGMEHLDARDQEALGETIRLDARLFYDKETNQLLPEKKVLLYAVESSATKKDIGATNAVIDLTMPDYGRVSTIAAPFKTPFNESINQAVTYNWWAALCIEVEPS